MPSKKSSPNAPGSYTSGGVRCTLDAPFSNGSNKGSGDTMAAPFNAPRAGGDNGLPTTISGNLKGAKGTPKPSDVSSLGTIKT